MSSGKTNTFFPSPNRLPKNWASSFELENTSYTIISILFIILKSDHHHLLVCIQRRAIWLSTIQFSMSPCLFHRYFYHICSDKLTSIIPPLAALLRQETTYSINMATIINGTIIKKIRQVHVIKLIVSKYQIKQLTKISRRLSLPEFDNFHFFLNFQFSIAFYC